MADKLAEKKNKIVKRPPYKLKTGAVQKLESYWKTAQNVYSE